SLTCRYPNITSHQGSIATSSGIIRCHPWGHPLCADGLNMAAWPNMLVGVQIPGAMPLVGCPTGRFRQRR
ncbi:MAG: hypothetical protein ACK5YR_11285, partial [Pirellula sp.]